MLAESLALCLIGAALGMALRLSFAPALLPPDFPVAHDPRVLVIAAVAALVLALAVGLPPAIARRMQLQIVDALAGPLT